MNRKQRRAASHAVKRNSGSGQAILPSPAIPILAAAQAACKVGDQKRATLLCRQALDADPQHVDSLQFAGIVLLEQGLAEEAVGLIGKALLMSPARPDLHYTMASAFRALSRLPEATTHFKRAAELQPEHAAALNNLGRVLHEQGELAAAGEAYAAALLRTNDPRVRCNLGNLQLDQAKFEAALQSFSAARRQAPSLPEAHAGIGRVLLLQGRPEMARGSFAEALRLRPTQSEFHDDLARSLLACGRANDALEIMVHRLAHGETPTSRRLFVTAAQAAMPPDEPAPIRPLLQRALTEGWARPGHLARMTTALVARGTAVAETLKRVDRAWPMRLPAADLLGPGGLAPLAGDGLLIAMLVAAPISDRGLERMLTSLRSVLVNRATAARFEPQAQTGPDIENLSFWSALASQCFLNEYAFATDDAETTAVDRLRDDATAAIEAGASISPLALLATAACSSLATLPGCTRLLARSWPGAMANVLAQQVQEPLEEARLRTAIPQLTPISDAVSCAVQAQYEQHPYPRWTMAELSDRPLKLHAYIAQLFPGVPLLPPLNGDGCNMLVAGCGTGQQSLEVATTFRDAHVVAVDLSLASLAYAQRMTNASGIGNITYGQGDLLALGTLGRRFDVIQATGVLHHTANPMLAWRTLLDTLKPHGFMHVGLYSQLARRDVVVVRAFIAAQGWAATTEGIRQCRQAMLDADDDTPLRRLSGSLDFSTVSGCRDLLFHVHEHLLTLQAIRAFLTKNQLAFLGFDLPPSVTQSYRALAPLDATMVDLASWEAFEHKHPTTFAGMYQFWVQSS